MVLINLLFASFALLRGSGCEKKIVENLLVTFYLQEISFSCEKAL